MHIALLSYESAQPLVFNKIDSHITQLAEALQRHGNEVHVFTRRNSWEEQHNREVNGVIYHICPFELESDFISQIINVSNSYINVFSEVEKEHGKFDVVHGYDWPVVNALTHIKEISDAKIIFTLHSTEYGRCGNNFYEGLSSFIRDAECQGGQISDKVIVVSHYLKDEIRWLYNLPDWKLSIIYDGIDLERFYKETDPEVTENKYNLITSDHICLFVGRMTNSKEGDIITKALSPILKDFPSAKFIFVGNGDTTNRLKSRLWEYGLSDSCRFLGYMPDGDILDLYMISDIVCIPCNDQCSGIIALETSNKVDPVVIHLCGRGYLEEEISSLNVYSDSDSLSKTIKKSFSVKKLGKKSLKNRIVQTKYISWDCVAERVLEVYCPQSKQLNPTGA